MGTAKEEQVENKSNDVGVKVSAKRAVPAKPVDEAKPSGQEEEKQNEKDPKAIAKAKRVAKAKLALQKLHLTLPPEEAEAMQFPGLDFPQMSWTACHGAACLTSRIGIILYQETYYVYDVRGVPDFLKDVVQVMLFTLIPDTWQVDRKKGCGVSWQRWPSVLVA